MTYQEFLAAFRAVIVERSRQSDALNQLFAELVSQADGQPTHLNAPPERWASLEARHNGLMRSLERWYGEVHQLTREMVRDGDAGSSSLADVTLSDHASDHAVLDVDLDALEAETSDNIADPLHLESQSTTSLTGDFVWPEGSVDLDAGLSALDALSADLSGRSDPWGALNISDYRTTGSPEPLKHEQRNQRASAQEPQKEEKLPGPSPATAPALPPPLPQNRPAEETEEVRSHNLETLATVQGLASLAIKLILRIGESMHTGFSTGITPASNRF